MKISTNPKGVTLIELTVVIAMILTLVSATTLSISYYRDYQAGLSAGEELKAVYQAQRLFLADNPTTPVNAIVWANIAPYMANAAPLPVVNDLNGNPLVIDLAVSPPVFIGYDPSGSPTDGIWDAGK